MILWEGTVTEKSGVVYDVVLTVDAEKLVDHLSRRVLRRARERGKATATACRRTISMEARKRD